VFFALRQAQHLRVSLEALLRMCQIFFLTVNMVDPEDAESPGSSHNFCTKNWQNTR
jgi:hypothetical protein